jgi:hypothetical protein
MLAAAVRTVAAGDAPLLLRNGWHRARRVGGEPTKGRRHMAGQDQARTEATPDKVLNPVPVTPSRETERRAGLAFDVEKGVDLPGVPAGDQAPKNPGAAPAQEMGGGVGLALPGDPARKDEQAGPEGQRP